MAKMSNITLPVQFVLSRPEEYVDKVSGEKKTRWFNLGRFTLIEAKNGDLRLLGHLNHISGEIVGFEQHDKPYEGEREEYWEDKR